MKMRIVGAVLLVALLAAGCSGAEGASLSASGASSTEPASSSQSSTITAPEDVVPTSLASSTAPSPPVRSATSRPSVTSGATDPSTTTAITTTQSIQASTTATTPAAWTPPDYGSAKAAVDAYLKLTAAGYQGLVDPSDPPTAVIQKYSQGPGRGVMLGAIADEKEHGRAWRGTPDKSRVLVVTTKPKVNEVILSDCPVPSSSWEEYDVKTGKVVPQPKRNPPPPYEATMSMFKVHGTWVMVSFKLDASKTCTR